MAAAPARDWYLLQARPRQAERAFEHLQRQAYQCYLPTHSVERVSNGRRQQVMECLFPNYLFIRLSLDQDNWMPIRSTRGVSRLVGFGGMPLRVPERLVEQIRLRCHSGEQAPLLCEGDKVRIIEGSLAELEAIFVAHDSEERVLLLINLLQRENVIRFPLKSVRKL